MSSFADFLFGKCLVWTTKSFADHAGDRRMKALMTIMCVVATFPISCSEPASEVAVPPQQQGATASVAQPEDALLKHGNTSSQEVPTASVAPPKDALFKLDIRATPDYQAGYKFGRKDARDHVNSGSSMPMPIGLEWMAERYSASRTISDEHAWRQGFKEGFYAGFTRLKPFNRDASKYAQLSWKNASVGKELYDYSEKHIATISVVDRERGLILVRYTNGALEYKLLDAVAPYCWVRR